MFLSELGHIKYLACVGVFVGGMAVQAWGGTNSLFIKGADQGPALGYKRSEPVPMYRDDAQRMAQRVIENEVEGPAVLRASWITVEEPSPKDFRVHDLVTIVVNEVSRHTSKADSKTEREYDIDAQLSDWFELKKGGLRASDKVHGEPGFGLTFESNFEGTGDVSREDSLSARIQAEVIDVLPNGNLVLEANHTVITDDEVTKITLTGTCRTKDIGVDNTIVSSRLANLEVRKNHLGMARNATKPGFLSGLFSFLSPF